MRHNTPHPKELRSRHSKLLHRNDIDGHMITHESHHDKVCAVTRSLNCSINSNFSAACLLQYSSVN